MPSPELRYAKTHEWARVDGDICTVGITDFAVGQLTDLVYVELPEVGAEVKQGEPFGEIESVKAVEDLHAPVSGTVTEVHKELSDDLDVLAGSAFDEGWMIKIKMSAPSELESLLDEDGYKKSIEEE